MEVCNQTISAPFGPPSAANTWQRFTVPLTAATFNVDSATFQKVMSQVTQFRIRTEMHDGTDVGGVDNVAVGSRFSTGFDAGSEGWTAAGDGTMEWKSSGGNPGGYLQISDWATGDWHWAVAPLSWAGDWRNLIGANIGFDMKTNYPDYASIIEISCTRTKRLILAANPFVLAPGGSSNMTVSLSESAAQAVVVSLNSSAPSCITVPASVTVAQGQTSVGFLAQAAGGAAPGCEAVITASEAVYGTSYLTLPRGFCCQHIHSHAHTDGDTLAHAHADADLDPWRLRGADRGGNDRPHAGLSPAYDLHQPAGRAHRRQQPVYPEREWQPGRVSGRRVAGARLGHQRRRHRAAGGEYSARRVLYERRYQC